MANRGGQRCARAVSLINNDAFDRATNGVYIAAWNIYLNQELKYTSNSAFTGITDVTWDWTHKDPTGKTSQGRGNLNTVPDLAAIMGINPDLKVFQGYCQLVRMTDEKDAGRRE
ncbi:hypothetical protein [Burkholderia cenocepacia]|uniref:hypothetical protein n=1 Tax=Burkholderia cenocepacia TaxID=95486 RepID=UPI0039F0C940